MTDLSSQILPIDGERAWIRLRTQVLLRWIAIAGQAAAIAVAVLIYDLQINTGLAALVIGISAIANLVATVVYPENKRLSERESLTLVLFDIAQLAVLLYLTGGLHNPFAVLLLGPVMAAANVTSLRPTLFVGVVTICIASALVWLHVPLHTVAGNVLEIPALFVFGNWVAIVIAVSFLGAYSTRINLEIRAMSNALVATQMALAREQKLTDLGGVVAAAAHELGTPLATIKLASAELIDELEDQTALREDAILIRDQANRCRDILRDMGQAGKDDLQLKQVPVGGLVLEAAQPHLERGIELIFDESPMPGGPVDQPIAQRKPEVIHGLRNLVQNAVDFANSQIHVETRWTADQISVRISDDGPGFPPQIIGRLGDPMLRARRSARRPGYDGMGLGLFIAKTLLERTGAEVTFANASRRGDPAAGAIVQVTWPRSALDAPAPQSGHATNRRFVAG